MAGVNILGDFTFPLSPQGHSSVEIFPRGSDTPDAKADGDGGIVVQDWIADWKRWSRAERWFAIALVILSLAIPLGLMIST
jgi:hypothetical protein